MKQPKARQTDSQTPAAPPGWVSRVPLEEIAQSFDELLRKLIDGDLPPRPFWLEVGNSGYKITDENRVNISLGMLMGLEVRGHLGTTK